MPAIGDAYVKIQGVDGTGGGHLDLVTDDVLALTEHAIGLGADVVTRHVDWYVLRSPGGQLFCITPWHREIVRPTIVTSPDGVASRLDQIAIDVSPARFDSETAFWPEVTGWPAHTGSRTEFHVVQQPADLPVRLLIQRVDEDRPTSMHHDLACADVPAIRAWHERLGATYVADGPRWTVMRDPAGGVYCLTARSPETGLLAA